MNVYIVRHGQTLFNYLERVQGWSDSPLTEKGIKQGKAVAEYLSDTKFDKVYSSDLKRAIETAEFIIDKQQSSVHLQTTPLLREAYYGSFEGGSEEGPWTPVYLEYGFDPKKIKEDFSGSLQKVLENHSNEEIRNIIAENDPLYLAENFHEYWGRINQFTEEKLFPDNENNVLVVCHGGTSQLMLEILLSQSKGLVEPDNCSTTIVKIEEKVNRLVKYNNTAYLEC